MANATLRKAEEGLTYRQLAVESGIPTPGVRVVAA